MQNLQTHSLSQVFFSANLRAKIIQSTSVYNDNGMTAQAHDRRMQWTHNPLVDQAMGLYHWLAGFTYVSIYILYIKNCKQFI